MNDEECSRKVVLDCRMKLVCEPLVKHTSGMNAFKQKKESGAIPSYSKGHKKLSE